MCVRACVRGVSVCACVYAPRASTSAPTPCARSPPHIQANSAPQPHSPSPTHPPSLHPHPPLLSPVPSPSSTNSAPAAIHTGLRSEMGEAVQMLPPSEAVLRIGGPANQRACSTTALGGREGGRGVGGREGGGRGVVWMGARRGRAGEGSLRPSLPPAALSDPRLTPPTPLVLRAHLNVGACCGGSEAASLVQPSISLEMVIADPTTMPVSVTCAQASVRWGGARVWRSEQQQRARASAGLCTPPKKIHMRPSRPPLAPHTSNAQSSGMWVGAMSTGYLAPLNFISMPTSANAGGGGGE